MTYEIELKIQLSSDEKQLLEAYLHTNRNSIKFLGGYEQTDYYFDTVKPSFAEKDIALRVRSEKKLDENEKINKLELTYKGKKLFSNSKTRLEYNLNLVQSTDFSTVEGFFNELGFTNSVNIQKKRKNYLLETGVVLSVDTNEIGDFIEIEKISDNQQTIEKTEDYLWEMLQNILNLF